MMLSPFAYSMYDEGRFSSSMWATISLPWAFVQFFNPSTTDTSVSPSSSAGFM